jgi:hypothetical protein
MKHLLLGLAWLVAMSSAAALAAGSDELWEVSTKMDMPGMPFSMPGQTTKVCVQKGHEKDPNNAVPKDKDQDCKMSDAKVSGNKSSWKMKCEGKHPMTGSGEMTYGEGTYTGKMKMQSKDGDMTMVYDGKRVGTCNYATDGPQAQGNAMKKEMEAQQAQGQAELAKQCKEALAEDQYSKFLKPDCSWATDAASKKMCAQTSCPDVKPQMCERLSKKMNSSDSYKDIAANKEARKLIKECGLPFEKATRDFCHKQLDDKNYEDLAKYCEKEARPLFDKNCAGRDYTAAMDSKFGPICRRFGKWKGHDNENPDEGADSSGDKDSSSGKGSSSDKKSSEDKKSADDKKSDSNKDSPVNKLLDGAKGLKGLFKF